MGMSQWYRENVLDRMVYCVYMINLLILLGIFYLVGLPMIWLVGLPMNGRKFYLVSILITVYITKWVGKEDSVRKLILGTFQNGGTRGNVEIGKSISKSIKLQM